MDQAADKGTNELKEQIEAMAKTLSLMILRDSIIQHDEFGIEDHPRVYAYEYFDVTIDISLQDLAETIGLYTQREFNRLVEEKFDALEKASLPKRPPRNATILPFARKDN